MSSLLLQIASLEFSNPHGNVSSLLLSHTLSFPFFSGSNPTYFYNEKNGSTLLQLCHSFIFLCVSVANPALRITQTFFLWVLKVHKCNYKLWKLANLNLQLGYTLFLVSMYYNKPNKWKTKNSNYFDFPFIKIYSIYFSNSP